MTYLKACSESCRQLILQSSLGIRWRAFSRRCGNLASARTAGQEPYRCALHDHARYAGAAPVRTSTGRRTQPDVPCGNVQVLVQEAAEQLVAFTLTGGEEFAHRRPARRPHLSTPHDFRPPQDGRHACRLPQPVSPRPLVRPAPCHREHSSRECMSAVESGQIHPPAEGPHVPSFVSLSRSAPARPSWFSRSASPCLLPVRRSAGG
jgi:hypothetical protein